MLSFTCDYMEGAHESILERLASENRVQHAGYGHDPLTASATERIRQLIGRPEADVHLLVGGTQTNQIVIDAMLRHNEGVIAADSGHVNVHESGAIEATGHKVIALPAHEGKLNPAEVKAYLEEVTAEFDVVGWEHYVVPRAIYISQPTEWGTIYTLAELEALRRVADRFKLFLYIDGARLGYGLGSPQCDMTMADIGRLADAFYIGGTKMGALMGEAVVATNPAIHLTRGLIKRRGALLAKGWLLGLQFDTLLADGLYFDLGRRAVEFALQIRAAMERAGYKTYIDSPTNQQFFVLPNAEVPRLAERVGFDRICAADSGHSVIRLCTGWATTAEQVRQLIELL